MKKNEKNGLVGIEGMFFHVIDEHSRIQYQGKVVKYLEAEYYLCQFYDALVGEPSSLQIRCIAQMGDCYNFYETHDAWIEAYYIDSKKNFN